MSSKHTHHSKQSRQSLQPSTHILKNGLKQIGNNIIDPEIKTEEDNDFNDSNYPKQRKNNNDEQSDDYDESNEEQIIEIDQNLQENVIKYANYYDLIKEKKKEVANIKKLMDEPKKLILQFLARADVNQLNVSDGKLIKNVSKKKKTLKEDIIKQAIKKKIKDESIVQSIIDEINNIRTASENNNNNNTNITLKRTYNRS